MQPLIQTAEDQASIVAIAKSWEKTPYVPDGAVKGTGCSCSALPHAILKEFGHLAPEIPRRAGLAKVDLLPTMRNWLNGHPQFYAPVSKEQMAIGDVILIDAGIGHLLLMIDGGNVVHSWQNKGVHQSHISSLITRVVGVWRPLLTAL